MKKATKLLAFLMSVVMLFSVMSVGMGGIVSLAAQSVEISSSTTADENVVIVVPETVYLTADKTACKTGQKFVNNTLSTDSDGKTTVTTDTTNNATTGKMYYNFPGASAVSITTRTTTGGDATFGGLAATYYQASNELTDLGLTLTSGISPGTTATIEWTFNVTYQSGKTATYYAYTVAYAPFYTPVAAAVRGVNTKNSTNTNLEGVAWISGIHSVGGIDHAGGINDDMKHYVNLDYLSPMLNGVHSQKQNDAGSREYLDVDGATNLGSVVSGVYVNRESSSNQYLVSANSYTGNLTVDTSRYTNLNQIPNLNTGFVVPYIGYNRNNNRHAGFHFSDITDSYDKGTSATLINDSYGGDWSDISDRCGFYKMGDQMGVGGQIDNMGENPNKDYDYVYNGAWNRDITGLSAKKTYVVQGAVRGECNQTAYSTRQLYVQSTCYLDVTPVNKAELRALMLKCTSLNKNNYTSESWSDFYTALSAAGAALGNPTETSDNVNKAYNDLVAKAKLLSTNVNLDAATNGGAISSTYSTPEYLVGNGGFARTVSVTPTFLLAFYNGAAPAKSGYKFVGWSTVPDVTVTNGVLDTTNISVFSDGAFDKSLDLSLNGTLYAIFAKDITVTFHHLNSSQVATTTQQTAQVYNNETSANITAFNASDVGDYKFNGWAETGTSYTSENTVDELLSGVTANKDLYATYKKTVTLSFNLNGGSLNNLVPISGDIFYNYDLSTNTDFAAIALPSTAPSKTGYGFNGWMINGTLYNPGDSAPVASNTTADADWSINKYNVTFSYKNINGIDKEASQSVEYNGTAVIPSDFSGNYARNNETQHYKLTGWDKPVATTHITSDTSFTASYTLENHDFEIVTVDKTCTVDGSKTYTCKHCGYSYTETIPASHEWGDWIEVPATCYAEGYRYHVCSECNASEKDPEYSTEKIAHTYNGHAQYESGAYYHYCTVCAAEVLDEAQRPGDWKQDCTFVGVVTDPAACEHAGTTTWTCEVCNEQYTTTIPALTHDYVAVVTPPTCTKDGFTTWTCSLCGDSYESNTVKALGHEYGPWTHTGDTAKHQRICIREDCDLGTDYIIYADHRMEISETVPSTCETHGHNKYVCIDGCGYTYNEELPLASHTPAGTDDYITPPTCTQSGLAHGYCAVCGTFLGEYTVDPLGHDYSAWVPDTDGLTHTHVCSRCDETEPGHSETKNHEWNDGVTKVPAGCETNSITTFTCLVCGETKDVENEDAHGHNYIPSITRPTCTEGGYTTYTCSYDASHYYKSDYTDPAGHSWDMGTVTVTATCQNTGIRTYTCTVCGETREEEIPIQGHTWSAGVQTKAPTCSEVGIKEFVCTYCGEKKTEDIPMLSHVYTTKVTVATCTTDGYTTYTCKNCDYSYDDNFVIHTGHQYTPVIIAPTCTSQGYTTYTCQVCFHSYRDDYVDAVGHDMQSVITEPTCTTQGYTTHTCQTCGYHYNDSFTSALGHDYSIIAKVDPTCTEQGYTNHTCTRCDSSYRTDFVKATGHHYVLKDTVQPGSTVNGYYLFECTECQDTYKETIYAGGKALVCYTLYDGNGTVVPNATIVITRTATGETETITTDANGYFTWIFPEGAFSLNISKRGYNDIQGVIYVSAGEAEIDIPVMPKIECDCLCHSDSFWGKLYRLLIKMFSIFGKIYCCDDCQIW